MVECGLPKAETRVRFPSPAPISNWSNEIKVFSIMNLTELLDATASRWPQKPALIEDNKIVSYEDLVRKIAELSSELQMLRVQFGCRVGLCLPNSINYVTLTFALWRINAVVVPTPTECTA